MVLLLLSFSSTWAFEIPGKDDLAIHGFISQGYLLSNKNNFFSKSKDGTFEFNELGINFSTDLTPSLRLGIQFFARDLGRLSNDKITVDWAFADYHFNDALGLRVGKMKLPIGLYNKIRDLDMLRTNIILPQSIYNEAWRDVTSGNKGVQIYGTMWNELLGSIQYQGQLGTVSIDDKSGVAYTAVDNIPTPILVTIENMSVAYMNTAALFWDTPIEGLRLGQTIYSISVKSKVQHQRSVGVQVDPVTKTPVYDHNNQMILLEWSQNNDQGRVTNLNTGEGGSGAVFVDAESGLDAMVVTEETSPYFLKAFGKIAVQGADDFIKVKSTNLTSSLEYTWNDLVLAFEYSRVSYNLKLGDLPAEKFYSMGFYGSATYRFSELFEMGLYYSEYYRDDHDKDGKNSWETQYLGKHRSWLKDSAVSTRFDLTDAWVLKFEYHLLDGAAWILNIDNRDDYARYWHLFATKVNYRF